MSHHSGRRWIVLTVVTAVLASLVTVVSSPRSVASAALRPADTTTTVPGQQPGDLIRYGESTDTMPGFSYNNRVSGIPAQCNTDGSSPSSSGLPYCQGFDLTSAFQIISLSTHPTVFKMIGNVAPGYQEVDFRVPYNGYDHGYREQFFTAASHGWLYDTELDNGVSSGGYDIVACFASTPCEVDLRTQDTYGGYIGDAFAKVRVVTVDNGGGVQYRAPSYIPLTLTRAVTGYVRDASGNGLAGATVTATGPGGATMTATSGADTSSGGQYYGSYTFPAIPAQSGWTFSATDSANDIFDPPSWSPDLVHTIPTQDFVVKTGLTASIALTSADGSPFTGGATAVGQQLNATVTLNDISKDSSVTNISADPPVAVDPSTSLTLISGPTPAVPSTLPAGGTASYTMSYTVATPGRATLSVHVTGTQGSTNTSADASVTANLGQPIKVMTTFTQNGLAIPANTIKLADADAGEIPQDIQAVVTLTNISSVAQVGVNINGRPVPSFHTGAHASSINPLSVTAGPPAGYVVGTLAPGATSAPLIYTVNVRDNGVFDLATQVLSSDQTGTTTNVSTGLGTLTALPTALLYLSLKAVNPTPVQAGTEVQVFGTLTNRSETQAVFASPLEPVSVTGNAGGGRLVDDTSPANLALSYLTDGVQLPFLGRVEPGAKIELKGVIDTAQVPATRATLTYQPAGQVINDDGTTTDLRSDQVGTTTGTSPVTITVSASDPVIPPADTQELIANYENSVAQGTVELADGGLRAGLNFLQHPYDGTVKGVNAVAGMIVNGPQDLASASYILASIDVYSAAYGILTPQQRANFEAGILADFDASHVKADNAEVAKAIDSGFSSFADALAHHDYNRVASLAGTGTAIAGNAIATAVLTDLFFQNLSLGIKGLATTSKQRVTGYLSNSLVLADKARDAGLAHKIVKTLDGIKAGQNLLANSASALVNAWGLTPEQITRLTAFCRENGLIVAVRARSKRAAQLIARGLAVGKNEVLKLKGVNELDVEWLGYSQADLNKLANAEPIPHGDLVAELKARGASKTTTDLVLERWKVRYDEWHSPKVNGVMEAANREGKISWGFNGKGNGVPKADREGSRIFRLKDVDHYTMPYGASKGKPRKYQLVQVGNKEGVGAKFVAVTQDVDAAAFLSKNNRILSAALREKVYEYMSDVLGIEHPETVSWINDGDILFAAKLKELRRLYEGGGETLAIFDPTGAVRAGFINPALTIYDAATKSGTIMFEGGYNNVYSKAKATVTVNLKKFF